MTPKTPDPKQALLIKASEFLRYARDLDARSPLQKLLDCLKLGREVVSNLASEIASTALPEKRPGKRPPKVVPVVPGINDKRLEVFYSPISRPGWWNGLLLAINTGRAMGLTRFEIELDGDLLSDEVPDPRLAMMQQMYGGDREDWKNPRRGEDVPIVRLYAWAIE